MPDSYITWKQIPALARPLSTSIYLCKHRRALVHLLLFLLHSTSHHIQSTREHRSKLSQTLTLQRRMHSLINILLLATAIIAPAFTMPSPEPRACPSYVCTYIYLAMLPLITQSFLYGVRTGSMSVPVADLGVERSMS